MRIPFNKPYLVGREKEYVLVAIDSGFTKGNGPFARKCHEFLKRRYGFGKCLLTTSCTARCPEAERWAETIVRLPLFPNVDVASVVGEIGSWCGEE